MLLIVVFTTAKPLLHFETDVTCWIASLGSPAGGTSRFSGLEASLRRPGVGADFADVSVDDEINGCLLFLFFVAILPGYPG